MRTVLELAHLLNRRHGYQTGSFYLGDIIVPNVAFSVQGLRFRKGGGTAVPKIESGL